MFKKLQKTPLYGLWRVASAAESDASGVKKPQGINCAGYTTVSVQIVPISTPTPAENFSGVTAGTSNPDATVWFWNQAMQLFIKHSPAIVGAKLGAGIPYEFDVEANGRIIYVTVSDCTTAQGVALFIGGAQREWLL